MAENTHTARQPTLERLDVDPKALTSAALARLIEEVRNDPSPKAQSATTYNRMYHRHNR